VPSKCYRYGGEIFIRKPKDVRPLVKPRCRWEFVICLFGSAAQRGLWLPVALQPSAGYGFLWLCSPARAMASCGSAAQRGLWPLVSLQPSAGYGFLWLCSPARAMASCGSAAQRGLWPPVALQPNVGYGLLAPRGFIITHNAPQSVGLLWTSDQLVADTST
jgi:hypothetical protein